MILTKIKIKNEKIYLCCLSSIHRAFIYLLKHTSYIYIYISKFMYLLCFFYSYKTPQKRVIVRNIPNLTYTGGGGAEPLLFLLVPAKRNVFSDEREREVCGH